MKLRHLLLGTLLLAQYPYQPQPRSNQGGNIYYYDSQGRYKGFSAQQGGTVNLFDNKGQYVGREQLPDRNGGAATFYDKQGRYKGYSYQPDAR